MDTKEKTDEADLIAYIRAQLEGPKNSVEISTTTSSEPHEPEHVNPKQIESGSADGESMDVDELLGEQFFHRVLGSDVK